MRRHLWLLSIEKETGKWACSLISCCYLDTLFMHCRTLKRLKMMAGILLLLCGLSYFVWCNPLFSISLSFSFSLFTSPFIWFAIFEALSSASWYHNKFTANNRQQEAKEMYLMKRNICISNRIWATTNVHSSIHNRIITTFHSLFCHPLFIYQYYEFTLSKHIEQNAGVRRTMGHAGFAWDCLWLFVNTASTNKHTHTHTDARTHSVLRNKCNELHDLF